MSLTTLVNHITELDILLEEDKIGSHQMELEFEISSTRA